MWRYFITFTVSSISLIYPCKLKEYQVHTEIAFNKADLLRRLSEHRVILLLEIN